MCISVFTGQECWNKENCKFAHSKSELVVFDCPFGENCFYVKKNSNGVYTTVEGKFCKNKHPGETKDNFCSRTFKKQMFSEKKIQTCSTTFSNTNDQETLQDKDLVSETKIQTNIPQGVEETLLLLPEELACEALKIMISSGKMNIQIKLI